VNAVERLQGVVVEVKARRLNKGWSLWALGLAVEAGCLDDALVDLAERLAVRVGCDVERLTLRLVTQ
jgi:hypothetical protein